MQILDWLTIIGVSLGLLSIFFSLVTLFFFFRVRQKEKQLKKFRPKQKKKRLRLLRAKKQLSLKKKRLFLRLLLCLSIGGLTTGGACFILHYQATNLGTEDKKAIVSGYYYLEDLEKQVAAAQSGENVEKAQQNIQTLASRLAAFALNRANYRIGVEGQGVINRYYTSLKELGINLSSWPKKFYKEAEQMEEFQRDVQRIHQKEEQLFKDFRINKSTLRK